MTSEFVPPDLQMDPPPPPPLLQNDLIRVVESSEYVSLLLQ